METMKQENPWGDGNIKEFLYYCCPECDIKCKDGQMFIEHAVQTHDQAKEVQLYMIDQDDEEMQVSDHNEFPDLNFEDENLEELEEQKCDSIKQEESLEQPEEPMDQVEPIVLPIVKKELYVRCKGGKGIKKNWGLGCTKCKFWCVSKLKFDKHVLMEHTNRVSLPLVKKEPYVKAKGGKGKKYWGWACQKCDYWCLSKAKIDEHVSTDHAKGVCQHCQGEFEDVKEHIRNEHIDKFIKCDVCDTYSVTKEEHQKHYKIHVFELKEDGLYHCDQCELTTGNCAAMRTHQWRHANIEKCTCDICGKVEFSQKNVEIHKQVKHFGVMPFECNKCDKKFATSTGMENHIKKVHEGKRDTCSICGKSVNQLSTHMAKHHGEDRDNEIICELCGKSVKSKSMYQHMKRHDTNKMCTICNRFFTYGSKQLINHLVQDHHIYCNENDYYVCHTCNQKCHSTKELQDHLVKIHDAQNDQNCDNCVASFPTKSLLAIHLMDSHNYPSSRAAKSVGIVSKVLEDHGTNTFQCDICNKKLSSKRTLFDHKKSVHDKSKHLKCEHCDFTHHELCRIKRHVLTKHTKATKFPCDQCTYVTNLNSELRTHKRRVHEGYRTNPCTECGKKFNVKYRLAEHMLAAHNIAYDYSTPFGR